jgi:hypothetical protein
MYPTHRAGRQPAACLRCWLRELQKGWDRIKARARMQIRLIARGAHNGIGWSHKRGAAVVAAGDQQSRGDIGPVLAPEEVEVSFEDRPQADTGPQPAIIEQEGRARGPVCANDALVAVNRQQHAYGAALRRRYRDDPLSTELLSKKSLFYGPRRSYRKGASQRVRSFRELGIDGRYVQDCYQSSVGAEYRRAGAAQVYVSRSEMLASVDGDRSLFDDAGADAVRALHLLGPHAAKPSTPILEAACLRIVTAMLDCDARAVTE